MEEIRKEIGEALYNARKKAKISRVAISKKLGVTDVAVYYWETGRNTIDVDVLQDYCEIVGVDWIELLSSIPSYRKTKS